MIEIYSEYKSTKESYCLLGIIVNRGKSRKISQFASKMGFTKANCLLAEGRSAATSRLLELLALDEGGREMVLLGLKKEREEEMLRKFNDEFHFDKPHKGIAFTIPIFPPGQEELQYEPESPYVIVITILNEDLSDDFSAFIHKNGYLGLTSIKARGAASITNPLMDMKVEPAKSMLMMIMHHNKVDGFVDMVTERYNIESENTGIILVQPLSKIIGLSSIKNEEQQIKPAVHTAVKQLLIALVPNGCAEEYIHKMTKSGVSGSTIIHSRLSNLTPEAGSSILPFSVDTEEEMVITLASHSLVKKIRKHIDTLAFDNQIEKPYAISLPVIRSKGVREENANSG